MRTMSGESYHPSHLVCVITPYCNGLLGGLAAKDVDRFQRLQNRAAKLISRSNATLHITPTCTYPQRLTLAAHSKENKL